MLVLFSFFFFFLLSCYIKQERPLSADPGYRLFRLNDAHDDPSGLPLSGNNKMETEVGPHNISIFEFLLNDHHAQIKSTQQDLFRRSTFLHHGNRSLLTLKSNIVQPKHDHYH